MAKKKTETKTFVPAALADTKWINTPFAYARLAKDLTLLQQNVLLMVSNQLQDYISRFFSDGRHKLPDDPNSLFPLAELPRLPRLEIKLEDFGVTSSHFEEVEKAANALLDLRIKAPSFREDGTPDGYRLFSVFSNIHVPKQNEEADKDVAYNTRVGYVYANINADVAAYAFNMRLGYINHPLQIAQDAAQVYSPRLYFLIKHYMVKGKDKVRIQYQQLREDLGMNLRDEEGNITKVLYPQFSRFRINVLDAAKADIYQLGERNLCDITFEYEPIYRGFVNRGDPECIEFTVKLTKLGLYHKDPKKAREHMQISEEPAAPKRRGRPRKQPAEDNQPDLFNPENTFDATIVGDKKEQWEQMIKEYGEGPLTPYFSNLQYIGTSNGAFSIEFQDYKTRDEFLKTKDKKFEELLAKYLPDALRFRRLVCSFKSTAK